MPHFTSRMIAVLSLLSVLFLFGFRMNQVLAQDVEAASIRNLIDKFFAAYVKEDIEGLMSLWSENSTELSASKQSFLKSFTEHEKIEVKNLEIGKVTIDAGKAQVCLKLELSALSASTGKPAADFGNENRTLRAVKEGGTWKISQYVVSEEELAAGIIEAKSETERRALFDANKDLQTKALFYALREQEKVSRGVGEDYFKTLAIYRLALEVAERIDDKAAIAIASNVIGLITLSKGNLDEALTSFERARTLWELLGDKSRLPDLLNDIGQVHFGRGDPAQSLVYFRKSLALAEEMKSKNMIAFSLNSIGYILSYQGDYLKALDYYRRSLALCEELGETSLISTPLLNIGSTYRVLGNNALALEFYQRSLKLSEADNNTQKTAIILGNIGQIHHSQGNYAQALEYFQRALGMVEAGGNKAEIVDLEHFIGNVHVARKEYSQGLAHYEKSLALNDTLGQNRTTAFTLLSIGNAHVAQGNHLKAIEYFQRSLALSEKLGETPGIASAQIGLSSAYLAQANYPAALDAAERALVIASQINKPDVLWMAHDLIGQSHRALGRLDHARQSFSEAIAVIEKIRVDVAGGEQDKQRFFEDKLSPYHRMIELLIASNKFGDALLYAERAKARTLLDVLSSGRVNVTKAMTIEENERERALLAELVVLNSQILQANQQRDEARSSALKGRLEKARLEYEAFQVNLYASHPELKIQRGQSRPLAIDEAEELLPDDKTALLEYVVEDKASYLFVMTKAAGRSKPATLKVYRLELPARDLAQAAEAFRQQVASRDLTVKTTARRLYDRLIKPAENQLPGMTKLIVVPDGPLWDLPFQALHRGQRYLLEDFAISYAPSLSVLREMKRKGERPSFRKETPQAVPTQLLALGNPVLNLKEAAKLSLLREEDLGSLPSAEREVNILGELYGRNRSRVLVGDKATEEEVKAGAEKYRLLHFATHAVLDDRNPMYSRIMLSRTESGKREDGMLEAWELMKLDLTAEMVVLSACQTARGRVGAGEGMIGISWALFVAGSPAVVVSQWKVDSARTTELMIAFHQNLLRRKRGEIAMTKAEALRAAAMKLLHSEYNHPVYWAGFVLVGNER